MQNATVTATPNTLAEPPSDELPLPSLDVLSNVRLLVVHEHEVAQFGYRVILGRQAWISSCLAARDRATAVTFAQRFEPHVALVDAVVGEDSGADIVSELRRVSPNTRLLLTSTGAPLPPLMVRSVGASGYIAGNCSARDLVRAVGLVAMGMTLFPPRSVVTNALSNRERAVLASIAMGATNREIADQLFISPHTVKQHTSALYRKLRARNRAEAVQLGQRLGLVD